jgi:ABC-type branched-subunit amino acid transport system substrate-binding protein
MIRACSHRELRHGPPRSLGIAWAWGAALGLAGGVGCSLTLDLDDQIKCSADSDCPYNAGQGSCVDGFCRPPGGFDSTGASATDTGTSMTDPTAPTTSASMTDPSDTTVDSTDSSTTETTGPLGCALNSECESDQRCGADGTCVDLLSAECQILEWPDGGQVDNVVFVGSIMPTSPPFGNLVQPLENAVQLAIEDFNQETSLPGDRLVAWVGCDDSAGGDAATNAATHLINNVGVPAIIGPIFSESVLQVANDVAIPGGTFMMAPAATAMSIAALEDENLVWRTIAGDVYQSNAIVDRFIDLDAQAEVSNLLILAKDDAYGNGILSAILTDLEAALPSAAIYYDTYPNPTSFASEEELLASYGAVLAAAAGSDANDPYYTHVLFIGTSEIQALLYSYLGVVWQGAMGDPMPLFTITHGAVPELERFIHEIGPDTPGTEALVPLKPLIESRLQGTTPVVLNPDNFEAFSVRYRIRFNDEEPLTSSALSYDATMSTLFSMCTVAAEDAVTGAGIAAGMPRLVDAEGEPISFSGKDLSFIVDARNALATGDGSVDLQGVSGELQWDTATGDIRADVWGWDVLDPSMPPDGSMPTAAPTRIYLLNPAPATDGTWADIPPG